MGWDVGSWVGKALHGRTTTGSGRTTTWHAQFWVDMLAIGVSKDRYNKALGSMQEHGEGHSHGKTRRSYTVQLQGNWGC